jgi:hypothetical protein
MKVCIKCNAQFPDTERFCDIDGTPLVSSDDLSAIGDRRAGVSTSAKTTWILLAVAVVGVVVGVFLFLVYLAVSRTTEENSNQSISSSTNAQPQMPSFPVRPAAEPSVSPSVEPSPSPSVEPSPSPQVTATPIQLSSNPISTASARGQSGPVLIRLTSGLTIEADEAWQTGEGIWYRRSSVLTLLDPKDVKAIEKVPPPSPQPTSATASPSP